MSPEPNPARLLSPERLAEIRTQLDLPRARNAYVTDYGVAADVVEELSDHIAAREAQVKQALTGLLLHSLEKLPVYSPYREMGEACNRDVHAAAKSLGIDL